MREQTPQRNDINLFFKYYDWQVRRCVCAGGGGSRGLQGSRGVKGMGWWGGVVGCPFAGGVEGITKEFD
jgi:hypothetical protein